MNKVHVLKPDYQLDLDAFFEHIRMDRQSRRSKRIMEIIKVAQNYMRPVALFKRAEIQIIDNRVFSIDKTPFCSSDLVDMLKTKTTVFPNIVSSGPEIEAFCVDRQSLLEQYITLELCKFACQAAKEALLEALEKHYGVTDTFDVFPGERDWELQQGLQIFKIFGKEAKQVGITISESGIPRPNCSAYGFVVGK